MLQVSVEGVIPETFVRVQTGHEGLTSKCLLVSLVVLTTSWFCSPRKITVPRALLCLSRFLKVRDPGESRLGEELGQRGHTGWRGPWSGT